MRRARKLPPDPVRVFFYILPNSVYFYGKGRFILRSGIRFFLFTIFLFLLIWVLGRFLLPFALPFLLGLGLAALAEPLVAFLCRRLRLPRGLSAGIGVTAVFLLSAGLVLSLAALLLQQLKALAGILPEVEQCLGSGIRMLEQWLLRLSALAPAGIRPILRQNVRDLFSGGTALLGKAGAWILSLAGGILTHIPGQAMVLGTTVLSGFMLSAKLPRLRQWARQRLASEKLRPLSDLALRLRATLGQWLTAQLKLCGVTWLVLTMGFILLAVPYAPLWALGIAALDALPVFGTGAVLIPWSLLSFLQGRQLLGLGLLGTYVTAALTRTVLEPRLVGRHLGLDPLVTLAALYCGYRLWGFGGMILAPLLAVTAAQLFPVSGENRPAQP